MSKNPPTISCSNCEKCLDGKFFLACEEDVAADVRRYCFWCCVERNEQVLDLEKRLANAKLTAGPSFQAGPSSQADLSSQAGPSDEARPSNSNRNPANNRISFLSKKRLKCPHADCRKTVSVLSFPSHCKYEHKKIPLVKTNPGSKTSLNFRPGNLKYNRTSFLTFISIPRFSLSAEEVQLSSNSGSVFQSATPVIAVMASKMSGQRLKLFNAGQNTDIFLEDHLSFSLVPSTKMMCADDVMIIWLASNFRIKKTYTLLISTSNNELQEQYNGPIRSMDVTDLDMFSEGDGLILSHLHINGMTRGCSTVILDIVVHA